MCFVLSSRLVKENGKSTSLISIRCLGQCLLSSHLQREKDGQRKIISKRLIGCDIVMEVMFTV